MEKTKKLIYSKEYTIRWQDMDAFKHVNHTIYFVYMQECRIDWLRSHGVIMDEGNKGPVIGEIACKYLRPITHPAEIIVELHFSHKTGRRIFFEHVIRDKDVPETIYATANATVIWVDFTTGRSIPEPEEYRHLLT